MICDTCRGVLEHRHNVLIDYDLRSILSLVYKFSRDSTCGHHRTWESLQASVDAGCGICQTFYAIENEARTGKLPVTRPEGSTHDNTTSNFISILAITPASSTNAAVHLLTPKDDLYVFTTIPIPALDSKEDVLAQAYQDLECTSSVRSLCIAERWLSDCYRTHEACRHTSLGESWFPTRLIDLGELNASCELARLILTEDNPPTGPYATLSHCWGQIEIIRLEKANLQEFLDAIPIRRMPKTFQDAVLVCKELSIRYLWIDSLCILQDKDDLSDWSREASLMHKVYSFSHCNISASDAEDATHGLFRNCNKSDLEQVKMRTEVEDKALVTEDVFIEDHYIWSTDVSHSTINKRGWVFQERLLAPRVLHFSRHQLYWECRDRSACETYPSDNLSLLGFSDANFKAKLDYTTYMSKAKIQQLSQEELAICYSMWYKLVSLYTDTTITEPSDRLVAISGIAKSFVSILKDEYLAGMWRQNLEHQLLWSTDDVIETVGSRSSIYRAPSWSWASMESRVRMNHSVLGADDSNLRAEIVDVHLEYKTQDTTGEISGGYLDLRGYLKPFHFTPPDPIPESPTLESLTLESSTSESSTSEDPKIDVNGFKEVLSTSSDMDEWNAQVEEELLRKSEENDLFYMPIFAWKTCIFSLILCRVNDQKGTFTRIGRWALTKPEIFDAFEAELDEEIRQTLPCLRYEGGKHTIRII